MSVLSRLYRRKPLRKVILRLSFFYSRLNRSFAAAGPRVWNNLPSQLRQDFSYGPFTYYLFYVTYDLQV